MPEPVIAPYGTTRAGAKVRRITLANEAGMSVSLLDYGGIVEELLVPDRRGRLGNVVLTCPTLADYETKSPYFGALVGRYANRIAGAAFTLDGVRHTLPANEGANTLHGGPADGPAPNFSHRVWDIVAATGSALTLRLHSPDGENGFPGDLTVYVTYTLTPDNTLRLDYAARVAGRATVLNLTNHAYFNLAGAGTVMDHAIAIAADRMLPVDAALIPTGAVVPVAGTPFDLREEVRIGARIGVDDAQLRLGGGFDHCFVLADAPRTTPRPAARVSAEGIVMEVLTTEPAVQFYSGNFLGGEPFAWRTGLCLETQHFPDSPNQPAFPSTVLRPGVLFWSRTVYRFVAT